MNYIFNRTNLAIIIVVVVIFSLTLNELAKYIQSTNIKKVREFVVEQITDDVFASQEQCQKSANRICEYRECRSVPVGSTVEDICGKDFKNGWYVTDVVIPEFFRDIDTVTLTIEDDDSVGIIELLARVRLISYSSSEFDGVEERVSENRVLTNDITRLVNKMVIFDVLSGAPVSNNFANDRVFKIVVRSQPESEFGVVSAAPPSETRTLSCVEGNCSRNALDVFRTLMRMYDGDIIEYPEL